MKRMMLVLVAGLFGGLVSAQTALAWPDLGDGLSATFYDGDPYSGGELVETDFTVVLRDSSVGKAVHLDSATDHVVISAGGQGLAFETGSVTNTASTQVTVGEDETLALGEVVAAIYDAAEGETNLAIFTDGGVVTGFYSYSSGVNTPIAVEGADQLMIATADGTDVFEVISAEVTRLGDVSVSAGDNDTALSRLGVM